jgi:uncharacterized membrane protein (UPF0127 family)
MRKIVVIGIFIAGVLALFSLFNSMVMKAEYKNVKIGNTTITAEIADSVPERVVGLMNKDSLADHQGMLFIFNNEDHHGIWMLNMSFPIDILWVDKDYKIIHIVENAQPCVMSCPIYTPDGRALYVVEVKSGFVSENQVKTGDSISVS